MLTRSLLYQVLQCRIRALCVVKCSFVQSRCFSVAQEEKQAEVTLQRRPPIVSVMGHVNHGKTSLLDYLRSTQVVEKEAGGITQHIGAFSVLLKKEPVTFLDTPGHEAFSILRSRGAQLTDLIVLVIAVDDGVQPQTVEVIELAHKMKVPLIVAVNKVDKGTSSVDKIFNQLLHHNVQVEQLGGDIQATSISATTGKNIDSLLEAILLQAELLELKANYSASVEAVVVESKMTKGFGPTASLIVQEGTLKIGDKLYSKSSWARIRAMRNETGVVLMKATPAMPVFTMGWKELPEPGEIVVQEKREEPIYSLEEQNRLYRAALNDTNVMQVPLLIKGDTSGSVESLISVLKSLDTSKATLNIVNTGIGNIAEGDLKTAQSIKGIVLGFGVYCSRDLTAVADEWSVPVLSDNVIYRLLGQLKDHIEEKLPPIEEEEILGEAEVLEMFKLTGSRKANVAGCKVTTGYLLKDKKFVIFRNNKPVCQGKLLTMKHHQNDVFRLSHGTECGLGFEKNTDIQFGDVIKCVTNKQSVQTLNWKF